MIKTCEFLKSYIFIIAFIWLSRYPFVYSDIQLNTTDEEEMKLSHHRFHEKIRHQEKLAELYYENQIKERIFKNYLNTDILLVGSNFPCLYGENLLGVNSYISIIDGQYPQMN